MLVTHYCGRISRVINFELKFHELRTDNAMRKKHEILHAFVLFGVPKGIRTPVTAVKGRCPRPLDDGDKRRKKINRQHGTVDGGGARRDRTDDLLHAMQALSQLSYGPKLPRGII